MAIVPRVAADTIKTIIGRQSASARLYRGCKFSPRTQWLSDTNQGSKYQYNCHPQKLEPPWSKRTFFPFLEMQILQLLMPINRTSNFFVSFFYLSSEFLNQIARSNFHFFDNWRRKERKQKRQKDGRKARTAKRKTD